MRRSFWVLPALLFLSPIRVPSAPTNVIATYGMVFEGTDAPEVVGSKMISYDTDAGYFISPPSIALIYRDTSYTLPLADPKEQMPTDPSHDQYAWATALRPDGRTEISVIDLTTSRRIYIHYGERGSSIPPGSGAVTLVPGGESHEPPPTAALLTPGSIAELAIRRFGE